MALTLSSPTVLDRPRNRGLRLKKLGVANLGVKDPTTGDDGLWAIVHSYYLVEMIQLPCWGYDIQRSQRFT
jgi:hypothetical protein